MLFTAFESGFRNCRGNRSHDFYDPVYPVTAEAFSRGMKKCNVLVAIEYPRIILFYHSVKPLV